MYFNELDISQKKILYQHLIENFNFSKTFDLMIGTSWRGYNPTDVDDLHRIVNEISESIIDDGYYSCGTAGFRIGIVDNVFYLVWDRFLSSMDSLDEYGVKTCDVYYYFDYNMFLRTLKINRIKECM